MALIARIQSQADMQLDFMRTGRSGEGMPAAEFRELAKRLVDEEVNSELLPAFGSLKELLQAADDFTAINPGEPLPASMAEELLAAYDEVADGIVDSVYVLFQMAHTLSIPFDSCFQEVHRSNMSKFVEDPVNGGLMAIKDAGGKILKGPNFSKPNLKPLLIASIFTQVAPAAIAEDEKTQLEQETLEQELALKQEAEHQDHTQIH